MGVWNPRHYDLSKLCSLGGDKMKKRDMFKDDSGAVTVDWVVLTADLVIIGGV